MASLHKETIDDLEVITAHTDHVCDGQLLYWMQKNHYNVDTTFGFASRFAFSVLEVSKFEYVLQDCCEAIFKTYMK